jgi:hypothetical protein
MFSSMQTARDILGQDFISPKEVSDTRKVVFSPKKLKFLKKYVPSEEILIDMKENNGGLVPVRRSLPLLGFCNINRSYFWLEGWYSEKEERKAFSDKEKTTVGWLALRKDVFPDSFGKIWEKQSSLVPEGMTVPVSVKQIYFIITYQAVRKNNLFTDKWVRTSSINSCGHHVCVYFDSQRGIKIGKGVDSVDADHLGLAVAWKLNQPAFAIS